MKKEAWAWIASDSVSLGKKEVFEMGLDAAKRF